MIEVNKRFAKGIITELEWNEYFLELVRKHGSKTMELQVSAFMRILQEMGELIKGNVNRMKEVMEINEKKD